MNESAFKASMNRNFSFVSSINANVNNIYSVCKLNNGYYKICIQTPSDFILLEIMGGAISTINSASSKNEFSVAIDKSTLYIKGISGIITINIEYTFRNIESFNINLAAVQNNALTFTTYLFNKVYINGLVLTNDIVSNSLEIEEASVKKLTYSKEEKTITIGNWKISTADGGNTIAIKQ